MSTLATLIAFAAEETDHAKIMLETIAFPIIALCTFALLALVTFSYRNVANRHERKAQAYAEAHANDIQQAGHGH